MAALLAVALALAEPEEAVLEPEAPDVAELEPPVDEALAERLVDEEAEAWAR